jgi:hypothetical protein
MSKIDLGQKFEEVMRQLEELEEKKVDVLKKPRDIGIRDNSLHIEGLGLVDFTKTGLQTFCAKLDLPSSYMFKLMDKQDKSLREIERDQEVFKMNIQRGLETLRPDTDIFFRTYNEGDRHIIRGVFSDRYNVVDNLPLLGEIRNYDFSQLKTEHFNVTSDYLDVRFTMPHLKRSIGKLSEHEVRFGVSDDIVFPAIHLRNSEVGRSKISIQFIIYRLVCTNGLINQRDQYRIVNKKHVGDYDLSEVNNRIADIVGKTPDMFEAYIDTMINSKSEKVEDAEEIILGLNKRQGITKRMTETVLDNWKSEQRSEATKHGIISAITAGARDWERKKNDFTGRLALEEIAGEMLFAKSL